MNDKNTNTTYKATTQLEKTLIQRVEELEQINLRLQMDVEARELAQEGLRYGQKFLREVISSIEDTYITVFDKNCLINFIWGSKKLEDKYGIIFQNYMGKDSDEFNSELTKQIRQVFETNQSFHGEWFDDRKENKIWWDYTLSPIRDEENDMVAVVSAVRDITESKKKEEKLWLNSQIMTNLSEGINLIRLEDGVILYSNPTFDEMFGYNPGEIIGKNIAILNAPTEKSPEETKQNIGQILLDTGEWHGEIRNIKKDGTYFWCYANVSLFDHLEYGRVIVSVHTDITERKKKEDELQLQSQIMTNLSEGINLVRLDDAIIVYTNPAFESMFGYNPGEMIGKNIVIVNASTEKTPEEISQNIIQILLNTGEWHGEVRNIKKDGTYFWSYANVSLFDHPEYGRVIVSVQTDITERKEMEVKLRESEERFRKIIENSDAGYFFINTDGNFQQVNPAWLRIHKYISPDEIIGRHFSVTQVDTDLHEANKMVESLLQGAPIPSGEFTRRCKDGIVEYHSFSVNPVVKKGKIIGLEGFLIDTTARRKIEDKLRENERKLLYAEKIATLGYWEWNLITDKLYWSDETFRIFGFKPQEFIPTFEKFSNFVHPDDLEFVRKNVDNAIKNDAKYDIDYRIVRPSKEVIYINVQGDVTRDSNGVAIRFAGTQIIITDRKKMEQKLRESEEKYRNLIENIPDVVWITQSEGKTTYISPNVVKLTGYTSEEIITDQITWFDMVYQDDIEFVKSSFASLFSVKKKFNLEYRIRKKDGDLIWLNDRAWFVHGKNKDGISTAEGIFSDITGRKNMELQLKENERKLLYAEKIANFGSWEWNILTDELYWSDEAFRIFGFKPQEFIPTFEKFMEIIHPDDLEIVQNHIDNALENDEKYNIDFRIVRPSGEVIYINGQGNITRDANGKATIFAGTQIIITNRKKMEEKLKESEEILRSILESTSEGILVVNEQGQVTHYNSKFINIWRIPQELIEEKDDKKLIDYVLNQLKDPEAFQSKVEELYRSRNEDVDILYFKDSRIFDRSSNTLTLNGEIRGRVWSFRDITERRKMSETIRKSQEKYYNLFNKAHVGIFSTRVSDGKCMECNEYFANMVGFDNIEECLDEYIGSEYYVNLNDREKILEAVKETGYIENYEVQVLKIDGTPYWTSFCVSLDLERQRLEGIVIDITDRKISEQKLKESAANFSSAIESLPFPFYMVDSSGKYIMQNASAEKIWGDLIGKSPKDIAKDEEVLSYWLSNNSRVFSGETIASESDYVINGELRHFYDILAPIFVDNGIPRILGVNIDITKRKMAERNLRDSEKKFRTAVENNPDHMMFINSDGIIFDVNRLEKGFTKEMVIGLSVFSENFYETVEQCESARKMISKTLETGVTTRYELSQVAPDGSYLTYETIVSPFKQDDDSKIISLLLVSRDITERKQLEKDLLESEEKHRDIINNLIDILLEIDLQGIVTYVSPQCYNILGYQPNELIGKNTIDFIHPEDIPIIAEAIGKALKTKETEAIGKALKNKETEAIGKALKNKETLFIFDYRLMHKNGNIIYVSARGKSINSNGKEKFIATIRDITEKKKAEQYLIESEEKFKLLSDQSFLGIAILQDDIVKYVNQAAANMYGDSVEDIMNWQPQEFVKCIHPEDLSFVLEQARKKQIGEKDVIPNYNIRLITKAGEIKWIELFAKSLLYENKPADFVSMIDITERKKIELELKESNERYSTFVKNYSGIAFRADKNSIPIFFHGAVKEITGYTEQEFVEGKLPWFKLNHPDDMPSEEIMYKMINTPDYAIQREYRIIRKDGQLRWVFESTQNIFDEEGKFIGVQGTINDITDLRRVEEALRESEGIMRSILENSPDYIMMIDKEGLIQFINRPLPGMKLSEFQYKKIFSVIGKNWHEILRDRISEIFKRGKAKSVKFKIQNSSRLSAVYEARFGALKRDWEIYGVIMICTDISNRDKIERELKESEEKNRNIINNIPDIVLETDMQGIVTYISPQCYDIIGYLPDELIGKNCIDFIHPEDISILTEAWGITIQTKETVTVAKYRLFHKNGDVINVFARGRYVDSNGNEKITLLIRDLTDPINK